jgi:hypothetical protein
VTDHIHRELDQEVTSIAGSYRLLKEVRLPFQGREVLYLVGHAAFDTSCCGAGGCAYALVPGYVTGWKRATNGDGLAVSQVEPIRDGGVQQALQRRLRREEDVQQVQFL